MKTYICICNKILNELNDYLIHLEFCTEVNAEISGPEEEILNIQSEIALSMCDDTDLLDKRNIPETPQIKKSRSIYKSIPQSPDVLGFGEFGFEEGKTYYAQPNSNGFESEGLTQSQTEFYYEEYVKKHLPYNNQMFQVYRDIKVSDDPYL